MYNTYSTAFNISILVEILDTSEQETIMQLFKDSMAFCLILPHQKWQKLCITVPKDYSLPTGTTTASNVQ